MEKRIKQLIHQLLCMLTKGKPLDSSRKAYIEHYFLTDEGVAFLLEDVEGLKLLTLGRRLLSDMRYPIKPMVVNGNFYITPRGRLFARKMALSRQALASVDSIMSFENFAEKLSENGVDTKKGGRIFPEFSDNFYPVERDACAWCNEEFPLDEQYDDVNWNKLEKGFRRPPKEDFIFHDDHFRLVSAAHFTMQTPIEMSTFAEFRKYIYKAAKEELRGEQEFTIYPFACHEKKAGNLWSYLLNSRLVDDNRQLSFHDVFLVRVTYSVHWNCFKESLEKPEQWKTERFWDEIDYYPVNSKETFAQ